jgi:outer membrane protein OmpA-like peptidoglycan-associated protein
MMKKMSLLALALVIALPGCCCRDKKKEITPSVRRNSVERAMDVDADVIEVEDVDNDDEDIDDIVAFDDIDWNSPEFADFMKTLEEEDEEEENALILDEDDAMMDNQEEAFNWVDAQVDDEFRKLYFSFNHYGIRPDQQAALAYDIEQVKQMLAEADAVAAPTVVLEGHACQEGDKLYNLVLSEKRAKAVADLFVKAGVDRSAIKVVGRGQECPVAINGKVINGSRAERAPNRRVEVRVIYT